MDSIPTPLEAQIGPKRPVGRGRPPPSRPTCGLPSLEKRHLLLRKTACATEARLGATEGPLQATPRMKSIVATPVPLWGHRLTLVCAESSESNDGSTYSDGEPGCSCDSRSGSSLVGVTVHGEHGIEGVAFACTSRYRPNSFPPRAHSSGAQASRDSGGAVLMLAALAS
jgi:hypothetical protein